MERETARALRLLELYAGLTTVVLVGLALTAFRQARQKPKFEEIDVERINVVEANGTIRLTISNKARAPDILLNGKVYHRSGGNSAGMIFYNDEGTENGGLGFGGETKDGKFSAEGALLFDQYNQDQTVGIMYSDENGQRSAGLRVWDRPDLPMQELADLVEGIKQMPDGPEKDRRMAAARDDARRRGLGGAQRVMVGKSRDKAAVVVLADPRGRPRLRLGVDSTGTPKIELLDSTGKVTRAIQ